MSQQTQSKGGWIASFMIVGAVLVLGLLAGLYYLKSRQIDDAASGPVATETKQTEKKDTTGDKAPAADSKQSEPKDTKDKSAKDSEQKQTPATNDTPATTQPENDEKPADSAADNEDSEPAASENLPETGPADTGAQLVALVALTVSGAAYVQSRRGL